MRVTRRPPGRPTDAPELRLLKGNPQRRPMRAPVDTKRPDGVPAYPKSLRAEGKRAWDLYWTYGKSWLAFTDIPVLTDLCLLHDEEAAIRAVLDKEGWFTVSKNTRRSFTHALVNQLHSIRNRMLPLWIECHLTPSSRGRANVKPAVSDPLAEWQAQ